MVVTISAGLFDWATNPADVIFVEIVPCTMLNRASIKLQPRGNHTFWRWVKRINSFNACSGFFTSVNRRCETIPTTKKNRNE